MEVYHRPHCHGLDVHWGCPQLLFTPSNLKCTGSCIVSNYIWFWFLLKNNNSSLGGKSLDQKIRTGGGGGCLILSLPSLFRSKSFCFAEEKIWGKRHVNGRVNPFLAGCLFCFKRRSCPSAPSFHSKLQPSRLLSVKENQHKAIHGS